VDHQLDGCCRFKDLVTDVDVPWHRRFRSDPDVVAREIIKAIRASCPRTPFLDRGTKRGMAPDSASQTAALLRLDPEDGCVGASHITAQIRRRVDLHPF
jgi:hypothetical protein